MTYPFCDMGGQSGSKSLGGYMMRTFWTTTNCYPLVLLYRSGPPVALAPHHVLVTKRSKDERNGYLYDTVLLMQPLSSRRAMEMFACVVPCVCLVVCSMSMDAGGRSCWRVSGLQGSWRHRPGARKHRRMRGTYLYRSTMMLSCVLVCRERDTETKSAVLLKRLW